MINNIQTEKDKFTKILKKFNLGELTSVTKLKAGFVNPAFLLNGKYVLRINDSEKLKDVPGHSTRFQREALLYNILPQFEIPVPECIGVDTSKEILTGDYILTAYIPGINLAESFKRTNNSIKKRLSYQLGEIAKKLHTVSPLMLGKHEDLLGSTENWSDTYIKEFLFYYSLAKENSYCAPDILNAIGTILADFKRYKNNIDNTIRLVHGDFSVSNLQVRDNSIAGIFDFEWSHWGDPLWDLQKLPINFQLGTSFSQEEFIKGYGIQRFNSEEIIRLKMYGIYQGFWEIWATKTQLFPFTDVQIQEGLDLIVKSINFKGI